MEQTKDAEGGLQEGADELPYMIVISDAHTHRVVARVVSRALAQAIFAAACTEYPTFRVLLTKGEDVLGEHIPTTA